MSPLRMCYSSEYALQVYGRILEVEIIFNERGSKVRFQYDYFVHNFESTVISLSRYSN